MKNKFSYYCLCTYIFMYILIPNNVNNLFGIVPIRLTLTLSLVLIYLIERIKTKEIRKINKIPIITFTIFILLSCMSLIVTTNIYDTIYTILKYALNGMLLFLILLTPYEKKQYSNIIKMIICASTICLIFGIAGYFLEINISKNGIYKYEGALGRVFSTFSGPSYFGMFCIIYCIFTGYLLFENKLSNKYFNYFIMITFYLAIINTLLTYTRSCYALLFGTLFVIAILNIKKIVRHCSKFTLFLIMLIFTIILIPGGMSVIKSTVIQTMPKFITKRFTSNEIFDPNNKIILSKSNDYIMISKDGKILKSVVGYDGSILRRKEFKKITKRVIKDNYLLGIGFGNYKNYFEIKENQEKYITGKFGYPHNVYLHIMAETGIFTTIAFIIFLITITFNIINNYLTTKEKKYLYILLLYFCINLVGWYESVYYDSQLIPIAIIIGLTIYLQDYDTNNNKKKRVMFISSVGGHLTQMLKLNSIYNDYNYLLVTEKNNITNNMKNKYKIAYLKYGSRNYLIKYLFIFIYNCFKSLYLFLLHYPDVIITTGTHTAVPMCYIGWLFRKKVIYIESYAKSQSPTLSGKIVYPIASTFIIQWKTMQKYYPKAKFFGGIY